MKQEAALGDGDQRDAVHAGVLERAPLERRRRDQHRLMRADAPQLVVEICT